MPLDPLDGRRSVSPSLSAGSAGRASPVQRTPRRVEDGLLSKDKASRRYAAGIERALASFDAAQQEWADYIAFLARLLKAIQHPPPNLEALPHGSNVALRLSQCLNPALPSGVHQKALEVYNTILSILGKDGLGRSLHIYLPSLLPVPSFASLSVRPLYYTIFEDYIVKLKPSDLRSATKSLILCLLPGIEDETSEDFERALSIVDDLRKASAQEVEEHVEPESKDGYFWQCFFLAVITNPSRRQGALAYLTRKLPNFSPLKPSTTNDQNGNQGEHLSLSVAAEAVITPEPGLLMRCFAAGLQDSQMLVQRGFLDLLVTHLPLNSPLFHQRLRAEDMDLVTSAAVRAVLRRDMSLNRRLWSWFLGPDPTASDVEDAQPQSPADPRQAQFNSSLSGQAAYFQANGAVSLQRSILAMLRHRSSNSNEIARPFRICLSLMDRWEVGGMIVPIILLPALESAYEYSLTGSDDQVDEVIRSASLFFDGVESRLLWTRLIEVFLSAFEKTKTDHVTSDRKMKFLQFVVNRFDIKEEEMVLQHIPNTLLIIFAQVSEHMQSSLATSPDFLSSVLAFAQGLLRLLPRRVFEHWEGGPNGPIEASPTVVTDQSPSVIDTTISFYLKSDEDSAVKDRSLKTTLNHIVQSLTHILRTALSTQTFTNQLGVVADALALLLTEMPDSAAFRTAELYDTFKRVLEQDPSARHSAFLVVSSIMAVITTSIAKTNMPYLSQEQISDLQAGLLRHIWLHLSPFRPKYHLEAVRLIWQLERLSNQEHRVEARLAMLVGQHASVDSAEIAGRFCVLWEHTMQSLPAKTDGQGRLSRRSSAMPPQGQSDSYVDPEKVLTRPLLLLLDSLQVESTGASDVIRSWLQTLPSLDRVFHILLSRLQADLDAYSYGSSGGAAAKRKQRDADQSLEDVVFCLQHVRNILRCPSSHTWTVLSGLQITPSKSADSSINATELLALMCLKALALEGSGTTETVHHASLTVLQAILGGPNFLVLKDLHIDDTLIDLLSKSLSRSIGSLQTVYLQAISTALKVRALPDQSDSHSIRPPSSSAFARASVSAERNERPAVSTSRAPPAELLNCLRIGLSSVNARMYLDHWVDFLDEVLPLYADAVFASLLPLVECICKQVAVAFNYLKDVAQSTRSSGSGVPVSALAALLHGLELVLAHVHRLFQCEEVSSPVVKPSTEHAPGFFGNMVSGVFTSEGPLTRTSRINSRLTMILSFQDAIRTCFSIWAWASQGNASGRLDPACAATTALNALKLRNKTRRILEHLFAAEELECLETLALLWSRPKLGQEDESEAVFNLLLVLDGSRPKNTVPVIINALYSRTNIDALDLGRRSSLTSDLTTPEVVAFLLNYTRAIEDDATDEIWTECTTFLRDVLSNPMPHRQILPGLLEYTVLLAEKIEHTNFGDLRKMRRDLGDIFLRLLTATFTARPMSNILESTNNRAADDLILRLLYVTPKLQIVLQGNDRVLSAVDTLSRSVIGPSVHAKSFPENLNVDHLRLFEMIAQQSPMAKSWKKDLADAFYNPRLLTTPADHMRNGWLPLLRKWALSDKDRLPELFSRLTPPTTAGIMFGVGANAARLEADRRTQLTLRKAVLLLLACEQDTFMSNLVLIVKWLVDLCTADASSSPSSTTRAEVFMVYRALMLSFSPTHLSAAWPVLNTILHSAILSCIPGHHDQTTYGNISLLQACKLLDLLVTLAPDEFQLHEWLYITNTIDAVYRPVGVESVALADEVAEYLSVESTEQPSYPAMIAPGQTAPGTRRPYLSASSIDGADVKAMGRDDFVRGVLQPFLSQLSMYAYEATYEMGTPDLEVCKRSLLEDVLDESTMA
ncbi:Dopey, N-terminal-domain-containing protein [Delphinella strobiligena]|nr:Dopey, N-terminal-domain-containing protein [Delphinella strobiligena]